jgi:hypothetical protein
MAWALPSPQPSPRRGEGACSASVWSGCWLRSMLAALDASELNSTKFSVFFAAVRAKWIAIAHNSSVRPSPCGGEGWGKATVQRVFATARARWIAIAHNSSIRPSPCGGEGWGKATVQRVFATARARWIAIAHNSSIRPSPCGGEGWGEGTVQRVFCHSARRVDRYRS